MLTTVWTLFKNIGLIFSFFRAISSTIKEMVHEKKVLPECQKSKEILELLAKLCDKKVIDIPELDEAEIAQALRDLEGQLTCKI